MKENQKKIQKFQQELENDIWFFYFSFAKIVIMTHHELAKKAILICSAYGLLSILQTLNSRFLYKTL